MARGQAQDGHLTMTAGEAITEGRAVKMSGSTERTVVYADSGEPAIGFALQTVASGAKVAIRPLNANGTIRARSDGSITRNSTVYIANNGQVGDSIAGNPVGIALDSATAADQPIEIMPFPANGGDLLAGEKARFFDDFFYWNLDESGSEGFWLLDANNSGAVTVNDVHGGSITLAASDTTATDNDESYIVSLSDLFTPQAGKRGTFKARVKLTEANTDDANIVFGLTSDTADVENLLQDNGAGPQDTATHMLIYKVDGGDRWRGSVRDTALDDDANVGLFTSGSWHELKITWDPGDGTTGTVTFFVDGVAGGTKDFTISSAAAMRLVAGVKNGGGTAETLEIDYVSAEFDR